MLRSDGRPEDAGALVSEWIESNPASERCLETLADIRVGRTVGIIRRAGDIGIGTSTPALDVHVKSGNTPAIRLPTATVVHEALEALSLPSFIKTTGSRGFHIYVPIVRGPTQAPMFT